MADMQNLIKQIGLSKGQGTGFLRDRVLQLTDLRTSTGLIIDASTTNPRFAAVETNFLAVSSIAGQTALGTLNFVLPGDFDRQSPYLQLRLLVASAAAADTPIISPTAYLKRPSTAIKTLTAAATAAVPASALPAWRTSLITPATSEAPLRAGDSITVNLVTGAHATDAIYLYALAIRYRSVLAPYEDSERL